MFYGRLKASRLLKMFCNKQLNFLGMSVVSIIPIYLLLLPVYVSAGILQD